MFPIELHPRGITSRCLIESYWDGLMSDGTGIIIPDQRNANRHYLALPNVREGRRRDRPAAGWECRLFRLWQ